jgi:hypothetical protein
MRTRAERAELRAGPHRAALLAGLELRRLDERQNAGDWAGSARVLERDAFWAEHGGALDLVVPVGAVRWVWRGVRVAWGEQQIGISGDGPPEVR